MKNFLIGLIIIIILAALGYGGWYYFIKKSPEGGKCANTSRCESGLNCVSGTCSSGKIGSLCKVHSNCQTGLLCSKQICSQKPDYSQYFDKITISKIKPGTDQTLEAEATSFTASTDGIGVNLIGVKPSTTGTFYYELVNSTTGDVAMSLLYRHGAVPVDGHDTGAGTDFSQVSPGTYDLNFYLNNELLYTTPITLK